MTRLILIEHERDAPAGLLETWARARGHGCVTVVAGSPLRLPRMRQGDVLVSLGSDRSVARPAEPWIAEEIGLLAAAHEEGRPILGVCFGGQALAAALGGNVGRAPALEPGWSRVEVLDGDLVGPGPWFRWHEDAFTVPPRARELARVGSIPMAFQQGAAFGLQFHPEVTSDIALAWVDGARAALSAGQIDEAWLRADIVDGAAGSEARAFALFDRFALEWEAVGVL